MILRSWLVRLRGSVARGRLDREMDAELQFHVDMAAERNRRAGLSPREARRQAIVAFGSTESYREEGRSAQRARAVENAVADIRFALRGLRRSPSFTVAALLTMALGIGASTAVFTVVDAVLLRPLPLPHAGDFGYVGWKYGKGGDIPALTGFQYEFLRSETRALEAVATYRTVEEYPGAGTDGAPIRGLRVTEHFFRVLGYSPLAGRAFDAREQAEGGPPVVVLGDALWRTRLGEDPAVIGRTIRLGDVPHTVIGVMPPQYAFPPVPEHTDYIVPMRFRVDPADEGHNYEILARARHAATAAQRAADLERTGNAFRAAYPGQAEGGTFESYTHADVYAGDVRGTLWVLFGAVTLVLLIACANTATLLLVRASVRQRELAVRAAIGASPARVLQQLLAEGLVLSLPSAALGLLTSHLALRTILAAATAELPAAGGIRLDLRVLAYATVVSIITGLVFGLAAGLPAIRPRLQSVLAGGARGSTSVGTRSRELLVLGETAVAVMLLSGATVLATSFARLIRTDPGFDANAVVAVRLGRLPRGLASADRERLAERALERIRTLPGVEYATSASSLPLERGLNFPVDIAERPDLGIGAVELRFISPDYFKTLAVPLLQGRDFNAGDGVGSEPVAIVNQSFARHFWADAPPIGRTIQIGHFKDRWLNPERQTRVVGVVGNMRELGLDLEPKPTVLIPRAQSYEGSPLLLARAAASPEIQQRLREAVAVEEPRLTPEVERLAAVVDRSVATPRLRALIIATFAGSALLLAAIGIYGVIAALVQQRRREIGVRLALGATRSTIALAVLRRCLAHVATGAIAGLLAFRALSRVLDSLLYHTSTSDPRLLLAALAILTGAAALAAWIPARRAARVDPALSLRLD